MILVTRWHYIYHHITWLHYDVTKSKLLSLCLLLIENRILLIFGVRVLVCHGPIIMYRASMITENLNTMSPKLEINFNKIDILSIRGKTVPWTELQRGTISFMIYFDDFEKKGVFYLGLVFSLFIIHSCNLSLSIPTSTSSVVLTIAFLTEMNRTLNGFTWNQDIEVLLWAGIVSNWTFGEFYTNLNLNLL